MSIDAKIENDRLSLCIGDLLNGLSGPALVGLLDRLACEDAVIKHVTDQIVDGWTDMMSHGCTDHPARSEPTTALDIARRRVALAAGDIAQREIKRLQTALAEREQEARQAKEDYHRLLSEHRDMRRGQFV